jgi:hypothetical protein
MQIETSDPGRPPIPFDVWKRRLRRACEHRGHLGAFNAITDTVLQLFWKRGLDPTVKAIVSDGAELLHFLRLEN